MENGGPKRIREAVPENALFLGIDLSTQSCKAMVVDSKFELKYSARVGFDEDMPRYKTKDGVHQAPGGHVTSPTLMWVEALELVLRRLKEEAKCPMDQIYAIAGSGQQHGSVYWKEGAEAKLKALEPGRSLVDQLKDAFCVSDSPIWMDTSSTESCKAMETRVGGALKLSGITGSKAYERFTGHLYRVFLAKPEAATCERLGLVSSFSASLLRGAYVGIDCSDGAGMNLMDVKTKQWDPELAAFVAGDKPGGAERLTSKLLGPVMSSWAVSGSVSPFFAKTFGFPEDCRAVHWSGDNPCSVVGLGLLEEGDVAISLGTSDTLLAVLRGAPASPLPFGHLFPHPLKDGLFFAMLCYANGDITRRKVRDVCAGGDWETFSRHLRETEPGNNGSVAIYAESDEITPPYCKGAPRRQGGTASHDYDGEPKRDCRAVVEMRALAMRSHLGRLGVTEIATTGRLLLTGGGSGNAEIRQVFADVFQRPCAILDVPDSAALGAAYRAAHAVDLDDFEIRFAKATSGTVKEQPAEKTKAIYDTALKKYESLEETVMEERPRGL